MKCFCVLYFVLFFILLIVGCQDIGNKSVNVESDESFDAVEVFVEGGGEFPEFLVGTWKAEGKSGWEIVFEPGGTISSAVISLGRFNIIPGKLNRFPMKSDKQSIIKPGQWQVFYSPDDYELTIFVRLDYVHIEIGYGIVEGSVTDVFVGTFSEDKTFWVADWTSFSEYKAHTTEQQNIKLSDINEPAIIDRIVFNKQKSRNN